MLEHLNEGRTPEQWVKLLSSKGMRLSSRALRTKAREMGCFYSIGRAMVLSPAHLETLLTAEAKRSGR
ncbi:MAG: hypothetical protein HC844_00885 [Tabrizicola sp.]|nr:hypothetical protein [Tabrizicola sp.]